MGNIQVKNIGKAYKLYSSRWKRLIEWFVPGMVNLHQKKWILQDINFTIHKGESVGILGINGAGKSTLLKMIVGTTKPTTGYVKTSGRIAALLELGMGFHPDFTGRQNVYMAGQLLGLTAHELSHLMPVIEEFSEIGDYIDLPIRVYSSGMQVRLAFSVATAIRPDILIVDEALAVGDTRFQQKCYKRINDFKSLGTTILFVTHDLGTIYNLCDRAIYIKDARLKAIGDVKSVSAEYEKDIKGVSLDVKSIACNVERINNILDEGFLIKAKLKPSLEQEESSTIFSEDSPIYIEIECLCKGDVVLSDPHIGFQIRDIKNNIMYETNTACLKRKPKNFGHKICASFKLVNNLCKGEYSISFGLANEELGNGEFSTILLDQVSPIIFSIYREHDFKWAGFANMRAK